MKYLVRNLKRLRKENKLTQQSIAAVLEMHRSNYSKVENGERELSIESIIKLADFFDMSVDELVREKSEQQVDSIQLNQLLQKRASEIDALTEEDKKTLYRIVEIMLEQD